MTLACEDANSKLVEVNTVADVDDEDLLGLQYIGAPKFYFQYSGEE